MRSILRHLAPLAGVILLVLLAASPAQAERGIEVGFADDVFADNLLFQSDDAERDKWAQRLRKTNAGLIRLNVYWGRVASSGEPSDATLPDQAAYDWAEIDRALRSAAAEGVEPLLTVLSAPRFAEGKNRPSDEEARPGTWKPDADKLRDFMVALARRYSGSQPDPLNAGQTLPRVRYYECWNEPNLHRYVTPQRNGRGENRSPEIYRKLLNGCYDGVKSVSSSNVVVSAGTGPFGDAKGTLRVPPVEFWRDVFCLKNRKKLKFKSKGCPNNKNRAKLDIFAHNSISEPGEGPEVPAQLADNATTADMHKLVDVVRAAEKRGTVRPGGKKREIWGTELWYESNPPERRKSVGLKRHARRVAEAIYVLWKQKVSAAIFLQLRDSPYDPNLPSVVGLQSGVYFIDGKAKPALDAVRFPFVADRKKKKVIAWGKAPDDGKVEIEMKRGNGGWKKAAKVKVNEGEVFKEKLNLRGKQSLRARQGKSKSISWTVDSK